MAVSSRSLPLQAVRPSFSRSAAVLALVGLSVSLLAVAGGVWSSLGAAPTQPAAPAASLAATAAALSPESIARAEDLLARPLPAYVYATPEAQRTPLDEVAPAPEVAGPPADVADAWRRAVEVVPYSQLRPRVGGWQGDFIHAIGLTARHTPGTERIPPSVTIAQAILDSGWGRSELGARYHNYFGIKAFGRGGTAGAVVYPTVEYVDGQPVWEYAAFRAYRSLADGVADHHRFLHDNARYRSLLALGRRDPAGFAQGLQRAGYATDPWYGQKLLALMDRYDLYRYDR